MTDNQIADPGRAEIQATLKAQSDASLQGVINEDGKTMYPMADIVVDHDFNCRDGKIAPIDVADLAKDIQENGLMQPVLIQPLSEEQLQQYPGKRYLLIGGFRRTTAHKVIGATHIWASMQPMMTELEARFMNLRENLQRKELSFAEEARAIAPMVKAGLSRSKICAKLGLTAGWVQLRTMFLQLPEMIRIEIQTHNIAQTSIREIYTAFCNNGELAAITLTKEYKEAKAKGLRVQPKSLSKLQNKDRKVARNKIQINQLTERLMDTAGSSVATRCLAWCAGEISDSALEDTLKGYLGDKYISAIDYAERD